MVPRSVEELSESSGTWAALTSFWRLPLIYVAMFLVRGVCIAAFMPFFSFIGSGILTLTLTLTLTLAGALALALARVLALNPHLLARPTSLMP